MIKVNAFDDNNTEFEMWIDPFNISFIIPEEGAIRIDGSFIKVKDESIKELLNILTNVSS